MKIPEVDVSDDVVVLEEFDITNFDLLRLQQGGTRAGKLFGIRTIKVWEGKTKKGIPFINLKCQIVTSGIHHAMKRRDVEVKKVREKVVVEKEIKAQPTLIESIELEDAGQRDLL